jgi:hypothetical protein
MMKAAASIDKRKPAGSGMHSQRRCGCQATECRTGRRASPREVRHAVANGLHDTILRQAQGAAQLHLVFLHDAERSGNSGWRPLVCVNIRRQAGGWARSFKSGRQRQQGFQSQACIEFQEVQGRSL